LQNSQLHAITSGFSEVIEVLITGLVVFKSESSIAAAKGSGELPGDQPQISPIAALGSLQTP
jgi:hypothetical protein